MAPPPGEVTDGAAAAAAAAATGRPSSAAKPPPKRQCKIHEINATILNKPDEFPNNTVDLSFLTPDPNSTFAALLDKTKEVTVTLAEDGSIFFHKNDHMGSFNLDCIAMDKKKGAGIYWYKKKIGRTTNLKTRYEDGDKGIVICFWDKLPGSELDKIDKSLEECFNLLVQRHFGGNFGMWLNTATIDDAMTKENDMGGISIFFCIYMHQVLEKDGLDKYGVRKGLHLQHIETAIQLFSNSTKGAQHEHLHNSYMKWLKENVDIIDKDLKSVQNKIQKMTGRELSSIKFVHLGDTVSWEPGYTFNSAEILQSKLSTVFKDEDISKTKEMMKSGKKR